METKLSQEEIIRYTRNLLIPEIGMEGQRKIKNARVLLVGSGGLGSPVALYLAAAGIGQIGIVDFDVVELSNLNRQIIHASDRIGMAKVQSAHQQITSLNPHVQVDPIQETFTAENAFNIVKDFDIILDGTDNLASRYLMNDAAVLSQKPYIYGAVHQFEGQISVFDARKGPCYRCIFPAITPVPNQPPPLRVGVFGGLAGMVGSMEVIEAIKIITGIGEPLYSRLVAIDGLGGNFQSIQLRKNPRCILCGENPTIHVLQTEPGWDSVSGINLNVPQITPAELHSKMQKGDRILLVDVRQPVERKISLIQNSICIPTDQFMENLDQLDPDADIILYCRSGIRSAWAARLLLDSGFRHVASLQGGINAWSSEIDPSIPQC